MTLKIILNNYSLPELKLIISELKLRKELNKNYSYLKKDELIEELASKLTLVEKDGISTLCKLSEVNFTPLSIRVDEKPKKKVTESENVQPQAVEPKPTKARKSKKPEAEELPVEKPQEQEPAKVNSNKKVKAIIKQIEEAQNTVEEMPKPEKKQRSKK
jgi:hypothetical protein